MRVVSGRSHVEFFFGWTHFFLGSGSLNNIPSRAENTREKRNQAQPNAHLDERGLDKSGRRKRALVSLVQIGMQKRCHPHWSHDVTPFQALTAAYFLLFFYYIPQILYFNTIALFLHLETTTTVICVLSLNLT